LSRAGIAMSESDASRGPGGMLDPALHANAQGRDPARGPARDPARDPARTEVCIELAQLSRDLGRKVSRDRR
jgi:hypothetical protein